MLLQVASSIAGGFIGRQPVTYFTYPTAGGGGGLGAALPWHVRRSDVGGVVSGPPESPTTEKCATKYLKLSTSCSLSSLCGLLVLR
jgi:hypothetical protein